MASSCEKSATKVNLLGKRYLEDDLETKLILKKHKEKWEEKETTKEVADTLQQIDLLDTKSDEGATKRKRTLFVGNLSCDTEISHIIDFFKDVGEVVHVRIVVNQNGKHLGYSYVQFASSNQAKMALSNKNGEYLHDHKILLAMTKKGEYILRPKYCVNHKVWSKDDYIGEAYSVEDAATRKKTLFVTNLSSRTKISDIIDFFKNVGKVVRVQLAVSLMCRPRRCGLVEFSSIDEAKKALEKNSEFLHDSKIDLAAAKTDQTPMYYLDHKVWYKDYLGQQSLPIEQDESPSHFVEDVLFVANLSPQTKIINVNNFFNNFGEVSVRLIVNHEGKHVGYAFVEFASSDEAKKALKEKNGAYLLDHQIFLDVATSAQKHNIANMLCYDDYLRRESLVIEDDETPNCVEAAAIRKNTIFVNHLSCHSGITHIIDFFKDVGEVVHVRLIANHKGKHVGYGFVEFASANEAKKALKKKNGEYLHDCKILLDVARTDPNLPPPKYCIDHKVWYEDYLRQENLLIEEDEAVEGLDATPNYAKEVAIRKKTLFVANLSGVALITNIVNFFKDVGEVRRVRLIVDDRSKNVGCAFVEFASANEAKKALEKKNGEYLHDCKILLDVARTDPNLPPPKYCIDHKVWYEDYLRQENLLIEEDEAVEGLDVTPDYAKEVAIRKKSLFVANIPGATTICNIVNFFKDVGEVRRVRLIVDDMSKHVGCAFVEFASANEAKKALRIKNGEKMCCRRQVFLSVVKMAPYPIRPKYKLAEMLWCKDNLGEGEEEEDEDDLGIKQNVQKVFCGKKITFPDDD